ncbi:response regulator transcription factor [Maribacter cobaltidurans]|nr:response regulator transcription factor [Maribacter cobaltidurans]
MKQFITSICFLFSSLAGFGQYNFSGHISDSIAGKTVYLSVIEDYRKISRTYLEQILKKTVTDSTGYFEFEGDNLLEENRMYKIHIDDCSETVNENHFFGNCVNTKSILFIANAKDTIYFPTTFNNEIFCDLTSTNSASADILKIDGLFNEMAFDFASFRSDANERLNFKKWFNKLQDYGKTLNEPLSELYIYQFLSDRKNESYEYFTKDLQDNDYYLELQKRLSKVYPSASFTKQFEAEIEAFSLLGNPQNKNRFSWIILLGALLLISLIFNMYLWQSKRLLVNNKERSLFEALSQQEEKIVSLINQGLSNKEIASTLFISVSTVKSHINNIYKKLNVHSRDQLKGL